MKAKYSKKRYKLQAGIQRIEMDTPDYSKAYEIQAEQEAKNKGISQVAQQFSGAYAPIGQVGGMAGDVIRNRSKNKKTGAVAGGAVEMGASGAALGAQLGGPWGAAAGLVVGGTYGAIKGAQDYKKIKAAAQAEEKRVETENFNKTVKEGTSTDAQSFLAKRGKYKVKSKQPRLIETEGREPIFSPKKPDGTRDLLYYNPNDPTHEEGGVKAVVMPRRTSTKNSLVGSGKMAYGAKQVKVNDLNNAALSQNFSGMPSANAANKFIQPTAGKLQVARQIPDERRKEKIRTPRSHKTAPVDSNRIIDPPMLYEMKPPPPKSTFNTKNDYKKGSSYIKKYDYGTSNLEIKKFAPGGDKVKAKASPEEREAIRRIQRSLGVKADGWWGPITQNAWERKNNITPKPDSTFTREDEREARKIFNTDFLRAEQERKADSTLYANRIVPTALNAAKSNKKVYVTEKRPGRPDTGRKTGNNACLTGVCNVNKMTGTNLPFNIGIASNLNIKGDNSLETRFNPAFQKNSEKLGYRKLKNTDKLQPGDVLQKSAAGIADHARLFLGNKKGPLIGEDHGNENDNKGFEVEDFSYLDKMRTVNDAMVGNPGLSAYRYVGLPKRKASMELARTQVKNNKEAIAKKKVEQQQKQTLVSREISPSPDELEFMKKGSKSIKVYK